MSKKRYSLAAYAEALQTLADIANHRVIVKYAQLELLSERAAHVIAMLRDPQGNFDLVATLTLDAQGGVGKSE